MKKKFINTETIEGYLYQHKLALKTVQDPQSKNFGKEFINGSVFVATDEAGLNVIEVHYTYVPVVTNAGSANKTFTALKQIMEAATWIENGKDAAIKVKLSPSLALNDFYDKTNTLVSAKRNEGGFAEIVASINADEAKRATFKTDIVMTSIKRVEKDEEKGITEDFDEIRGAIFDFKGSVLPFDFRVRNEAGMDYFEGLDISSSNPVFTTIWGKIVSQTEKKEIVEPTAFGEPSVRVVEKTNKEYCITGTNPDSPAFGDDTTITADELKTAMQNREVYLAEVKKRQDEYAASKSVASAPAAAPAASTPVQTGGFTF